MSSYLGSCTGYFTSCCYPSSSQNQGPSINGEDLETIEEPKSKRSKLSILTSTLTPITFTASTILLGLAAANVIDHKPWVRTVLSLGIGGSGRAFLEAILPGKIVPYLQKITSKSFFETFEILSQASQNNDYVNGIGIDPRTFNGGILDAIGVAGSFSVLGDWLFHFKYGNTDPAKQVLEELKLDKPCVNPILGPSFDNVGWQLALKTAMTLAGIGLSVLSYKRPSDLNALYRSLGFFLCTQGIGFFAGKGIAKLWEISEKRDRQIPDVEVGEAHSRTSSVVSREWSAISESGEAESENVSLLPSENRLESIATRAIDLRTNHFEPQPSLATKIFRLSSKIITSLGSELLASIYLINKPYLYLPAGLIYGGIQYFGQRKFQTMTQEVYQAQLENNFIETKRFGRIIKPALLAEYVASGLFLAAYLGWLSFGISNYIDPKYVQDRRALVVLIGSYLFAGALAWPTEFLFKPEAQGIKARIVNHLRFLFYHHPYLLTLLAISLFQISQITDRSLALDENNQYICGMIAIGLYGANFGLHRMRNLSFSGKDGTSPAIIRMLFFKAMYQRITNVFGI